MVLHIDGHSVIPQPDERLLDLVNRLQLDDDDLLRKPLAAKIAGEIFSLNYIPVRSSDVTAERVSIRRAMAASNGHVSLIRYEDSAGRDVYTRTAQFAIFLALNNLWPDARAKMNCTVGKALYVEVFHESFSAEKLKSELHRLVQENATITRKRMKLSDAIEKFSMEGQTDKSRLLTWRAQDYFDVYCCGEFIDYYYGELAPSLGYLQTWDILSVDGGFMFLFPDDADPCSVASYVDMPKFLQVSIEGERWCELMNCETVADLNAMVQNGEIRELIRVNEALHEKRFSQVADMICARNAKVVMLAGPSSSGKTTSANRLATQLRVHGMKPVLMSLDDYYIDRDKILPGPDGQLDLEHINTIDTALFARQLRMLLQGESVELPHFNFKTGKREWHAKLLALKQDSVIIVEGLHALNPVLLPNEIDPSLVFKLYVSPLLPLNLDDHNRIPTSMLRLLRRTVRDYRTRGSSVQKTMSMWDSVQRGEKKWIFPFQENADVIFNSSTLYELAVLKKYIYPLLTSIEPEEACYEQVRALVKILNYVLTADVEDEIPPTSLIREFIGGNTFYK